MLTFNSNSSYLTARFAFFLSLWGITRRYTVRSLLLIILFFLSMLPPVSCCSLSSLGFHLMLVMAGLYSPQSIGFLDKNVSQIWKSFMIVMIFNYFFWGSKILYPSLQATYTCASYWSNLGIFFQLCGELQYRIWNER